MLADEPRMSWTRTRAFLCRLSAMERHRQVKELPWALLKRAIRDPDDPIRGIMCIQFSALAGALGAKTTIRVLTSGSSKKDVNEDWSAISTRERTAHIAAHQGRSGTPPHILWGDGNIRKHCADTTDKGARTLSYGSVHVVLSGVD